MDYNAPKTKLSVSEIALFFQRGIITKKNLYISASVLAVILLLGTFFYFSNNSSKKSGVASDNKPQNNDAEKTLASQTINRDFTFPLKNDKGEKVAEFKYTIQGAEIKDEIIVKGQKATAVKGRTFLIINLRIQNDSDKSFQLNTRDYLRLSLNGNPKEWLAPEIHNDPVEVQAISTKYTRLGFPISDTDKNLKLRVGEIDGDKTTIDLNLSKP